MTPCSYRILAVDDDPVNQKIIQILLQSIGFNCTIAKNGREAVELFNRIHPDLIIMDLMMPEVDGFHATIDIRRLEFGTGQQVPIIACTAMEYRLVKEQCVAAGINDFMQKPITLDVLKHKVEVWLDGVIAEIATPKMSAAST
jgi:two-component system, sensor histidine kinase and response regulator